jgi:predicted regulator of Ras-like GTPase activity (Roadblock/LC7/MglB family)
MSDGDPDATSGEDPTDLDHPSAPPKRFTMKALGQLVDPESSPAATDEAASDAPRPAPRPAGMPGSRRRLQEEVSGRASRPEPVADLAEYEPDQAPDEVRATPSGPIMAALARAAAQASLDADDEEPGEQLRYEPDEVADTDAAGALTDGDADEPATDADADADAAPVAVMPGVGDDAEPPARNGSGYGAGNGDANHNGNGRVASTVTDADGHASADGDDRSLQARVTESDSDEPSPSRPGEQMAVPLESSVLVLDEDHPGAAPEAAAEDPAVEAHGVDELPLARHMLAAEVRPGGRLSDPHDVPGIVLNLAKDLPAAAAVSVVRIDEEIELVGNTIDPDVDPNLLATVFSGVFRTLQQAAGMLASGPLGRVHDVVIEAEHMDLVLRPLGTHYYLLVLEDRRSPSANLSATRLHMAAIAPGLAATLAQLDALES